MFDFTIPLEPQAEYDVTCMTEDCENGGLVIRVTAAAESPAIVCGPCGQRITSIVPA